jgi:hypothetical protein
MDINIDDRLAVASATLMDMVSEVDGTIRPRLHECCEIIHQIRDSLAASHAQRRATAIALAIASMNQSHSG